MKNILRNRKNILSVSTIFLVLLTMVAVTHYYLQNYSGNTIYWTLIFGYGILFLQAAYTVVYGCLNKDSNITLLGVEFVILALCMAGYAFGQLVVKFEGLYLYSIGLMLPLMFIPAYADKEVFAKPLLKKAVYFIPAAIIVVAVSALACYAIVPFDTSVNISEATYNSAISFKEKATVIYSLAGLLFYVIGMAFAVINLIKKHDDLFGWGLAAYSFIGGLMCMLKIFDKAVLADKFLSFHNVAASVMLISAVMALEVAQNVKSRKR